jgi:hypothetical protein
VSLFADVRFLLDKKKNDLRDSVLMATGKPDAEAFAILNQVRGGIRVIEELEADFLKLEKRES